MGFPLVHNVFAVSYRLFIAVTFDKKEKKKKLNGKIFESMYSFVHLWSTLSESVWKQRVDGCERLCSRDISLYIKEIAFFLGGGGCVLD